MSVAVNFSKEKILMISVLSVLAGCQPRYYDYEPTFGQAVHQNISMVVINPEGTPVSYPNGLLGPAAKGNIDRYLYSFVLPPASSNGLSMGLGTAMPTSSMTPQNSGALEGGSGN